MPKDIAIWIGREFYPKPEDYIREAKALGCSRKLHHLPADIVLGESKAWLFHKTAPSKRSVPGETKKKIVRHQAVIFGYFTIDGFVA